MRAVNREQLNVQEENVRSRREEKREWDVKLLDLDLRKAFFLSESDIPGKKRKRKAEKRATNETPYSDLHFYGFFREMILVEALISKMYVIFFRRQFRSRICHMWLRTRCNISNETDRRRIAPALLPGILEERRYPIVLQKRSENNVGQKWTRPKRRKWNQTE